MSEQVTGKVKVINEPATPHLSTITLPFGDDLKILWEGDQPVGLVVDRRLQEKLYQAMKLWRRPFLPHRLHGNTCPGCGGSIDDRARSCAACHPGSRGYDAED